MNIKNNRRRKESVAKIEKAFINLLQTSELDKITVSDICSIAEINRSTFYSNFIDIYDLADKVKENLENDFLRLYGNEIENKVSTYNFLKLFYHIRENQLFYKTYFKLASDNFSIIGYDRVSAEKFFDEKYIDYHIEFFKSGFNAIIRKWLKNGCVETPEEMEQILKTEYLRKF